MRELRTSGSVGAGGGRPPSATRPVPFPRQRQAVGAGGDKSAPWWLGLGRNACHEATDQFRGTSTPSRSCMIGLVVVYCRWTFSLGFNRALMANAASAASWNPDRISFFFPG